MLIRKLLLQDYGLFAGRHEFDLMPRTKYGKPRPIILLGGKNGAGKSTILEAIRVVLYGRLALGNRVRAADYDGFLKGRIHRGCTSETTSSGTMVAIEFEHVHRGTNSRYLVQRSWRASGAVAVEQLTVLKDGRQLDDVDAEDWQGFVRDIIPEGLSQLFFFDGEKIQELAEDATGSGVLADSIKSLLGLDLVERLDADLTVYANREVGKLGSEIDREKMVTLEKEIEAIKTRIADHEEELAANRTRQDGVQAEVRKTEDDLRREGEHLVNRRTRLQSEKVELSAKIEAVEKSLRNECDHEFPLALCPKTASAFRKQLLHERVAAHEPHVRYALKKMKERVFSSLNHGKAKLDRDALKRVRTLIESAMDQPLARESLRRGKPVHQLSESDQRKVLNWLTDAAKAKVRVNESCKELVALKRRLEHTERNLVQIPCDAQLKPRVEVLTELNKRLGGLEQARSEAEERLKRLRFDLELYERDRRSISERYRDSAEVGRRITLARNVQTALKEYLARLTKLKVQQLRETVAQCFNRLCRKGDVVKRIEIDPVSFKVQLFDQDDRAVPKEALSSGEKQIFAIAMLWGLAQTSGRPLPVIIDTPLGRLDSDHRRNLIDGYFPHVSHQVILLSTDTEVDQPLFEQLGPSVSHAYQLLYSDEERRTEVSDGYFWRRMAHV